MQAPESDTFQCETVIVLVSDNVLMVALLEKGKETGRMDRVRCQKDLESMPFSIGFLCQGLFQRSQS